MKTADLERSKRLKELGWIKNGRDFHWREEAGELGFSIVEGDVAKPTAGEMIEWLLQTHDIYFQDCQIEVIGRDPWGLLHNKSFSTEQGICNALADACAWVLERKK